MKYDIKQISLLLQECTVRNTKGKPLSEPSIRKTLDGHQCQYEERLDTKGRKQTVKTYSEMTLLKAFLSRTVYDDLTCPTLVVQPLC